MRRGRRIVAGSLGFVVVAAVATRHRFRPPVVQPGDSPRDDAPLRAWSDAPPAGHEPIEVALPSGEKLRGIFVPADEGSPIVVHLLEADGTVVARDGRSLNGNPGAVVSQLADLGFASLMVDQRGVGDSDGEASVAHFEADVHAIWSDALRRVGGVESRLFVRATSLGTIGAMVLLRDGAKPGGLVLVAPVDSAGVAERFVAARFGGVAGELAGFFLRPVADDARIDDQIARRALSTLILASPDDELWPANARGELREKVVDARAAWRGPVWPESMTDRRHPYEQHVATVRSSKSLCAEEAAFWKRFAPRIEVDARMRRFEAALPPFARDRLERSPEAISLCRALLAERIEDVPELVAWLALLGADGKPLRGLLDGARESRGPTPGTARNETWFDALDRDDPAGPLPVAPIVHAFWQFQCFPTAGAVADQPTLANVVELVRGVASPGSARAERVWSARRVGKTEPAVSIGGDWKRWFGEFNGDRADLGDADRARRFVRIMLKGAGIPDRVTVAADGSITLEARDGEQWVAVDPSIVFERVAGDPPVATH
jgi:serine aminopeptidase S33 family